MKRLTLKLTTGVLVLMMTAGIASGIQNHRNLVKVSAALQTVKAANEFSFGFGDYQNTLARGSYEIPLKMQNASKTDLNAVDLFDDSYTSMAGSCIKGSARVKIEADGSVVVQVPLQEINVFGTKAWGTDWQIYKTDSEETIEAEIIEGTKEQPKKIQFMLPDRSKNGVYVSVSSMGHPSKAIFAMNWNEAVKIETESPNIPNQPQKIKVPSSIKASVIDYQKVKVSWSKVDGADGYEVYQNGKKQKAVPVLSYTQNGLKTGSTYIYKVRAYKKVNGTKVYSAYTKDVKAKPILAKVSGVKVNNGKKRTATVTWKKVSGANGYCVYRATSEKGKYTQQKMLKGNGAVKYIDKKVKKNKKYFYKVRAYRSVSGRTVYGAYASTVKVKIKK